MFYSVLVPLCFDRPFTYAYSDVLEKGDIVRVPFRNKEILGVVMGPAIDNLESHKIKFIIEKFLETLDEQNLNFIEKCAAYSFEPQGEVLRQVLSGSVLHKKSKDLIFDVSNNHLAMLNESQEAAYQEIKELFSKNKYACTLLDGVTGSGKTEVYFHLMLDMFKKNKQVLVLQPEIALSTSWIKRFEKAFGIKPFVWHSQITPAQKRDLWKWAISGKPGIIVGARSALFLPFKNLGLIVLDEEHDGSYKQEERFIYQGRDMAVLKAHIQQCPILLASATPSLETYVNVNLGKYSTVSLKSRFQEAKMPDIHLVDLKLYPAQDFLTPPLIEKMKETFAKKEQSLLFLNRKGYAPLTLCKECGVRVLCPHCALYLVEHKHPQRLVCHHCGFISKYPKVCTKCDAKDSYIPWGPGIDRLKETVCELFPEARVQAITSDTERSPQEWEDLLLTISNNEIDIILATQILAKGHHFPKLTFIGIIDGDFSLNCLDLRASERTFQLLSQVSGRAGREGDKSTAMIQTHDMTHPVLKAFSSGKRDEFLKEEVEVREKQCIPPFSYYIALICSSEEKDSAQNFAKLISTHLYEQFHKDLTILGPIIAPLSLLNKKHRYRILIKSSKSPFQLQDLRSFLLDLKLPSKVFLKIDVDPYYFL